MIKFKPLLADDANLNDIDFGNVWLSGKYDGIRAIVIGGVVMSRSLKPIPNRHVQKLFGGFEHFDGELGVGSPTAPDFYRQTYSGVMKEDGEPDVKLYAFDHIEHPNSFYSRRYARLTGNDRVGVVQQHMIESMADLLDYEQWYLGKGFEGVMLRAVEGPRSFYKYGRSTAREGTLMKLKRFSDAEAAIVGMDEEMQNNNEATTDALGHTERSSHKANLSGKGRMGALVCKTPEGIEFRIGTGFTAKQRQDLWDEREALIGTLAKYKSFTIGVKDAPRFPVFLGLRSTIDI